MDGFRASHLVSKLLNHFEFGEEFLGEYSQYGVGWDCYEHAYYSGYVAGDEDYKEDLKRVGLHAVGVDVWLEDEYIYQVGKGEGCYEFDCECSKGRVGAGAVEGDDTHYGAECSCCKRADVWYYVQYSRQEC